jgi:hypothetical protein
MQQGSLLRDLDGKGFPFCSPTTAESIYERPMAVTRFSRRWAMVMVVFSEALALGTAPMTIAGPPPSNNSAQEV